MPHKQNPVLFVYIGWANRYDGTEPIQGSHEFIAGSPDDCSEIEAFRRRDGVFRCGIGSGEVDAERVDIVFVAKKKGERVRRVVGYYLNAAIDAPHGPNPWRWARTREAFWLPVPKRVPVAEWPGSSGVRRWAHHGANGVGHESLFQIYRRLVRGSVAISAGTQVSVGDDDELSAFEGQLKRRYAAHRSRERQLRAAKIQQALDATGRLACEVPGCSFDFSEVYGPVGHGFAHVHHLEPLARLSGKSKTRLSDLAIVCANCHAMIHREGESRSLEDVQPLAR